MKISVTIGHIWRKNYIIYKIMIYSKLHFALSLVLELSYRHKIWWVYAEKQDKYEMFLSEFSITKQNFVVHFWTKSTKNSLIRTWLRNQYPN